MKFFAIGLGIIFYSVSAGAAPNTGLPPFSAQSVTVIETARQNDYSDMATVDRLLADRRYAEAIPVLE
ncbi:unnamed protein product, partial [Laminaria digitata]